MKSYKTKLISVDRTNNTACVEFNMLEDGEVVYTCHHQTTIRPLPDFIRAATIECISNMAAAEAAKKDRETVYEYIDTLLDKPFEYTDETLESDGNQWSRSAKNYDGRKTLIVEVLVELGLLK